MAVAFNSDEKKSENRAVMDLMFSLVQKESGCAEESLLEYVNVPENERNYYVKQLVLDANIACKLAIRTFVLKD
jgi:hypothetical protein